MIARGGSFTRIGRLTKQKRFADCFSVERKIVRKLFLSLYFQVNTREIPAMIAESQNGKRPETAGVEEDSGQQWRLHLRRGIVASRRQGRRNRRGMALRMLLLLAAVLWVLFLVLVNR
ncbi:MAG: hypothetical protein EGP73_03835 [Alistipes indistinctus]|nr:hypothetical protein [Alistipes indistinctus]